MFVWFFWNPGSVSKVASGLAGLLFPAPWSVALDSCAGVIYQLDFFIDAFSWPESLDG